jgi:pantothenate synthetase
VRRRLRLKADRELRFELREVPLSRLPLLPGERAEARRLERAFARRRAAAATGERALRRAERRADAVLSDPRALGQARVRAEAKVQAARARLRAARDALAEVRAEVELFRTRVLDRAEAKR